MTGNRVIEEHVEHLLKCLQAEMTLTQQLLDLGKRQEQALIGRMDEDLHEITAVQDARLRQIAGLRKRTESSVKALAAVFGLDESNVTLLDLASKLGEPQGSVLQQMTENLVQSAADLYKQNLINKNLLNNAVGYVSFCLKLLSGVDEKANYGAKNAATVRANALVLDQTV